jgi:hypothetical protein
MNNVFKKRFRRKLGLSELIVECEKVSASLRDNELDEDFKSRMNNPINYIPNFPLLKTAVKSSTVPCFMPGEYTSLLLGLDQEAPTARKLHFDEPANDTTFEE